MVSKEEDLSTGNSYKQKYKELKRKLKYLVYENECFESDIRKSHVSLLQISREKSFVLDQLMTHETVILSDDSDPDSTDYSSEEDVKSLIPNYAQPTTSGQSVTKATKSSIASASGDSPSHSKRGTRGTSSRKGGRGGGRGAGRGGKTGKLKIPSTPSSLNHTHSSPKATPSTPLSLIVSLPRKSPNISKATKLLAPPHPSTVAARKKMKMVSPNSMSSSSSSSSDSDSSSDSSESMEIERKPSLPPPPPLVHTMGGTPSPIMGGRVNLLTPTLVDSPPVNVMTPSALTNNLALVSTNNLSLLSPVSPSRQSSSSLISIKPTSTGQKKVLLSLGGDRGPTRTAFKIVSTTNSTLTPHNNNR